MRYAGGLIRTRRAVLLIALVAAISLGPARAWALTAEEEAKLLPADGDGRRRASALAVAVDGDTAVIGTHNSG